MSRCISCNADWSAGAFGEGCSECGGGAMDHACLFCGGRCGQRWKRAVIDSQDEGMAHWVGGCGLPKEEQQALMRAAMEAAKKGRAS